MSNNRFPRKVAPARFILILGLFCLPVIPAVTPAQPAAADAAVTWTKVNIPTQGEAGGWGLASGSDIRHLTASPDGTLYAAVTGLTYTLYRSTDNGVSWRPVAGVQTEISAVAISPHDAGSLYYATAADVYGSTDGGQSFVWFPPNPGGAGSDNIAITSLAVAWDGSDVIAVGTRDGDGGQYGGVYLLDESNTYSLWQDTGLAGRDVYGLAFSPGYGHDRQLVAVVTDETDTFVTSQISQTGWGYHIGAAQLDRDNSGVPTPVAVSEPAAFVFPAGYNAITPAGIRHFFVSISTGGGSGDLYEIHQNYAPTASLAIDLNIGQLYGQANLDIASIASAGGNPAFLLAGAAGSAQVYLSSDGGLSWTMSYKEPTGDGTTIVLPAPDFAGSGRIYAATSGAGSALSVSRDSGATWNQVGLIDSTITAIVDLAPSPAYSQDATLFMLSFGGGHGSLWRSHDDGAGWERILSSYLNEVDDLTLVGLPPQYGAGAATIFAAGQSGGHPALWQSTDDGQLFRRRLTSDPVSGAAFAIDTWAIVSDSVLFVGGNNYVYRTDNGGYFYTGRAEAGNHPLTSLALSPGYPQDGTLLTGNSDGWVYGSTDSGVSFHPMPADAAAAPLTDHIRVAFDPGFDVNGTVYAASDTPDGGVARFVVGRDEAWEGIDGSLPAGAELDRLGLSPSGTLYATNITADGGLERCLNPTSSPGSAFETVTRGLGDGATLTGLWQAGNRLWSFDNTNLRLMTFDDTLVTAVAPVSPDAGATGCGTLVEHTVRNIVLDWATRAGATDYQWQCTDATNFDAVPANLQDVTTTSSARLPDLEPGTTYRWRVRANNPVLGPWSAVQTFTTTLDTEPIGLQPESPAAGESGIAVRPLFQWTAVAGATAYELLVAADIDFQRPAVVKTGEYALPANAWQCDVGLEHATTYYWKIRAVNSSSLSSWSAVGVFTTASPEASAPPEVTAAPASSPIVGDSPDPATLAPPAETGPLAVLPPTQDNTAPPAATNSFIVSGWALYLVGGLLFIIALALFVILAMAIRMRRP